MRCPLLTQSEAQLLNDLFDERSVTKHVFIALQESEQRVVLSSSDFECPSDPCQFGVICQSLGNFLIYFQLFSYVGQCYCLGPMQIRDAHRVVLGALANSQHRVTQSIDFFSSLALASRLLPGASRSLRRFSTSNFRSVWAIIPG
jgi:hypothetical protein